jgi:hypothetical protein
LKLMAEKTRNYLNRLSQNHFDFYNWVIPHFNIYFI